MSHPSARESEVDSDLIDLSGILSSLWRRRWIIAGCVAIAVAVAAVWVANTEPSYFARAKVMVEHDSGSVLNLRQVLEDRPLNESVVQSHIGVLRSDRLLADVVDSLELAKDPFFNSTAQGASEPGAIRRLILEARTLPNRLFGNDTATDAADSTATLPDGRRRALESLKDKLYVAQTGVSYLIEVGVETDDPNSAARIANAIADGYIALLQDDKIGASTEAVRRLGSQIADLEAQLEESRNAVESFRMSSALVDEERRQALSGQLDQLRESRADVRTLIGGLEDRIAENRMETEMGPAEGEDGATGFAQLRLELRSARSREVSLGERIDEVETRLGEIVQAESRLQQLERQAAADRIIYERMLEEMKEINALEDLQQAGASVIDSALPPLEPSGPSKKLALALALAGGGGLGLSIVALTELMRSSFRSRKELEAFTGVPVIGSVPRVRRARNPAVMLDRLRQGRAPELAEALREIQLGVRRMPARRAGKVVMMSSAFPRDGKSTITLLLAFAESDFGGRAVVVDCDFRRSRLAATLGLEARPSLTDVLSGDLALGDAVQVDPRHGLHVLGPWAQSTASPQALNRPEFGNMIDRLADAYDLVLIDTPPLGPVTDGAVVAAYADVVLHVVAWNDTPRVATEDCLEKLQGLGVQVDGLVLSKVDARKEAGYRNLHYGDYRQYWPQTDQSDGSRGSVSGVSGSDAKKGTMV